MTKLPQPMGRQLYEVWQTLEAKYPDYRFGYNGQLNKTAVADQPPNVTRWKFSVQPRDPRRKAVTATAPLGQPLAYYKQVWWDLLKELLPRD